MVLVLRFTASLFVFLCLASPALASNRNYFSPEVVQGAKTVSLQQAKNLFDAGHVFVDVRNPRLFRRKHLPGSFHLDLKNGFEEAALAKIAKKDQPVVIYSSSIHCARGYRAVALAVSWGFTQVMYFRGGIVEWKKAAYPFNYTKGN